jgi:hypothetical protein
MLLLRHEFLDSGDSVDPNAEEGEEGGRAIILG